MELEGLDFINIAHGLSNTRVYRTKGEFFCYTATVEAIQPFSSVKAVNMACHLYEVIKDSWGDVDLCLNYRKGSYSKKKMKKLNALLAGETDPTDAGLLKWVMMLM